VKPQSTTSELALVISDLGSGGAQRVLLHLVESWHKAGRRITVITLAGPEHDFFRLPHGVRRIVAGGVAHSRNVLVGFLTNIGRVRQLRRALREAAAPVVIAFVAQASVLTVLASIGLDLRVVAAERNDPRRQNLGPIWNRLREFAYWRADLVTANSRGVLQALADVVPFNRLAYLPNPLPDPPSCAPAPLTAPTILSVGRLHHQKAYDVLLRAFGKFSANQPDWRLAIVGEGPEEQQLRELAHGLRIANKVDWLGRRHSAYPFLRACRIFVLASRHEGMPNALLEAMSCALPCVVSDGSPGPLELVQDGVNGLVVPVEEVEALAEAMRRLAVDRQFADALGQRGRDAVKEHELTRALKTWERVLGLRDASEFPAVIRSAQ
jgi:glycosyltransferase involved in cell wall biosynthesis